MMENEIVNSLTEYILRDEEHRSKFGSGILSNIKRKEYKSLIYKKTGKTWKQIKSDRK